MNATNSWASNFRRNEEAEDANQACLARTIPTRPKNRRSTLLIVASKRADIPLRAATRDNSRMGRSLDGRFVQKRAPEELAVTLLVLRWARVGSRVEPLVCGGGFQLSAVPVHRNGGRRFP